MTAAVLERWVGFGVWGLYSYPSTWTWAPWLERISPVDTPLYIPPNHRNRYLELEAQGGVLRWFLGVGLFRDRLLMDAQLLEKLGIEMAVGAAAQMVAEWDRRRDKLWQELDFAFADVLTWWVARFVRHTIDVTLIQPPSIPNQSSPKHQPRRQLRRRAHRRARRGGGRVLLGWQGGVAAHPGQRLPDGAPWRAALRAGGTRCVFCFVLFWFWFCSERGVVRYAWISPATHTLTP